LDGWGIGHKVSEDPYKTLETSISCENLSDFGRGGGEMHEVGEGVEEREWRGTVEALILK
jgi:hypothetical protein